MLQLTVICSREDGCWTKRTRFIIQLHVPSLRGSSVARRMAARISITPSTDGSPLAATLLGTVLFWKIFCFSMFVIAGAELHRFSC